jgi:HK97 family phage major capsid protein
MSQQAFYQIVGSITGVAGGNRIDTLAEGPSKRLLGFDVAIAQKLPIATPGSGKAMLFFGSLTKAAVFGERRGVTIKRSDHRYFENDQIGLLGTERFDINVHDMGDNTTAGPLVALISP